MSTSTGTLSFFFVRTCDRNWDYAVASARKTRRDEKIFVGSAYSLFRCCLRSRDDLKISNAKEEFMLCSHHHCGTRKKAKRKKERGRSSNSSSPSSSASSSLGCRGGWENIAFFLTFPSNHRSLSLWNSYTQTRGFTAGYRQVLAEEQIVERGAFCRASFCRFFSLFFPSRRPLRGGGGGWMMFSFPLFFSLVFWKYASKATTTREEE